MDDSKPGNEWEFIGTLDAPRWRSGDIAVIGPGIAWTHTSTVNFDEIEPGRRIEMRWSSIQIGDGPCTISAKVGGQMVVVGEGRDVRAAIIAAGVRLAEIEREGR